MPDRRRHEVRAHYARAAAFMTGFAALVTPALARAQDEAGEAVPPLIGMLGTFIIAAISLFGLAWLRRRWVRETLRADHFQLQAARLEAVLAACPLPYCGWTGTGQPVADARFLDRLDLDAVLGFEAVAARLAAADRDRLRQHFALLHGRGEGFDLTVTLAGSGERVRLSGQRGRSALTGPDGEPVTLDLLWLGPPA